VELPKDGEKKKKQQKNSVQLAEQPISKRGVLIAFKDFYIW